MRRAKILLLLVYFLLGTGTTTSLAAHDRPQEMPSRSAQAKQSEVREFSLSPGKYREAIEYARARYCLIFVDALTGILALVVVLRYRVAPRLRNFAIARSRSRLGQVLIFAPLLLLTLALCGLPSHIYRHILALRYQQSIQGWGSWWWDLTKGLVIELLVSTLVIWILYATIRSSPLRWWFYFWVAVVPLIVCSVFLEAIIVDPLFFKFRALAATEPALTEQIGRLVRRSGLDIPPERMFEMEASTKLKSVNAYVTGIGRSKRVVVWDTTISHLDIPQTLAVFGHELGHYVLGHVWKGIVFAAAAIFLALLLGCRLFVWMLARWGSTWDILSPADWASLPVLLLLLALFNFFSSPVNSAFSRYLEHQADVYGLEITHGIVPDSGQIAAQSFQILGEIDLDDPDPNPMIEFWFFSHPPIKDRIEFALRYDPWSKGQPPQFVK